MSFLDKRQRAMLAEMGVRVWAPSGPRPSEAASEAVDAQEAPDVQPTGRQSRAEPPRMHPAPVTAQRLAEPAPRPAEPAHLSIVPPEPPSATLAHASRPQGVEQMDWQQLESTVASCQACGLCAGRTNAVFGVGSQQAEWMVIGEAPGENEDQQGEPFVGQAGKLLDNMLAAIQLSRQADLMDKGSGEQQVHGRKGVYIANVLKCRPPGNRNPQPSEIVQCEPYLRRQVALLRPRIILAMGRFAVQSLLQTNEPIGRLRGRVHQYEGVPVIVTYHPAYLLRALPDKAKAWDDLCLALKVANGQQEA